MNIIEIKERSSSLIEQLLKVWEESVKATYQYLIVLEKENLPIVLWAWKNKNLKYSLLHPKKEAKAWEKS